MRFIGSRAFSVCSDLKEIEFPSTLESIGSAAFMNAGLTSVDVPGSVENISTNAFFCSDLAEVTLHEGLRIIGQCAFDTSTIQSLVIPSTVESIAKWALPSTLTTVEFKSSVPPEVDAETFLSETISIKTPGWDPNEAFADCIAEGTEIVWANPISPLEFLSDPVADGVVSYHDEPAAHVQSGIRSETNNNDHVGGTD